VSATEEAKARELFDPRSSRQLSIEKDVQQESLGK
jgi:hypothetical protein